MKQALTKLENLAKSNLKLALQRMVEIYVDCDDYSDEAYAVCERIEAWVYYNASEELLVFVEAFGGRLIGVVLAGLEVSGRENFSLLESFSEDCESGASEVYMKHCDDGFTVIVRLESGFSCGERRGFADETRHAHKEKVRSNRILGGKYLRKDIISFDDKGKETADFVKMHIKI